MQRRQLLTAAGSVAAAALAGCTGGGGSDQSGSESTQKQATTTKEPPQFELKNLAEEKSMCMDGAGMDILVTEENGQPYFSAAGGVLVETLCYDPVYEGTTYDADKDMAIATVSFEETPDANCDPCKGSMGTIKFDLDVNIMGSIPKKIRLKAIDPQGNAHTETHRTD